MNSFPPEVLQNIAKFLNLRELFASFEPVNRSTKEVVNELCRQMKTMNLCSYTRMSDSEFIALMRRCCDVSFLALEYTPNMITCNQDLWEVSIYCPKLQIIVIHDSPIYANEFGNEVAARLAALDGSIPSFFQDQPIVNIYHMFCSTRIVHLVSVFGLRDSPITARVWALLKYVLAAENFHAILQFISLDHLVVCAFYAVCRVYNINITFHNILDVYKAYLQPFQVINNIVKWSGVDKLWLGIDLSFVQNTAKIGTMVDFYNAFFVPNVYPIIQFYHTLLQPGDGWHVNAGTTSASLPANNASHF